MLLVILKHVHAYEVGGTRQPQAGQSPSLRFVCQFRPSRAPPQDKDADQQADSNVLCMHKNPAASVLVSWIGLVRCDDGSIFQFVRSTDVQAGLAIARPRDALPERQKSTQIGGNYSLAWSVRSHPSEAGSFLTRHLRPAAPVNGVAHWRVMQGTNDRRATDITQRQLPTEKKIKN